MKHFIRLEIGYNSSKGIALAYFHRIIGMLMFFFNFNGYHSKFVDETFQ
jgi:hypothetical protein